MQNGRAVEKVGLQIIFLRCATFFGANFKSAVLLVFRYFRSNFFKSQPKVSKKIIQIYCPINNLTIAFLEGKNGLMPFITSPCKLEPQSLAKASILSVRP